MTENMRNNSVKQAGYDDKWVYMNECESYFIETEASVLVDCNTHNSSIKSSGEVIVDGHNYNTPISAEKAVIVKSNHSSHIKTKLDIYVLGDCIDSDIYTEGKVIILGKFEGGKIVAKEVNILGEVGKNITITEI